VLTTIELDYLRKNRALSGLPCCHQSIFFSRLIDSNASDIFPSNIFRYPIGIREATDMQPIFFLLMLLFGFTLAAPIIKSDTIEKAVFKHPVSLLLIT
jgi:hypothetical protein